MGDNSALQDLIHYYGTEFIHAYADAVALLNKKPTELLVQIENYNSHLMVALQSEPGSDEYLANITKAKGHLRRACLDCYKIVFAEISGHIKTYFLHLNSGDLSSISNIKELLMSWQKYTELIRQSRCAELANMGTENIDKAIGMYREAVNAGDLLVAAWKKAID